MSRFQSFILWLVRYREILLPGLFLGTAVSLSFYGLYESLAQSWLQYWANMRLFCPETLPARNCERLAEVSLGLHEFYSNWSNLALLVFTVFAGVSASVTYSIWLGMRKFPDAE